MRDHVSAVRVAGQRELSTADLEFGYRHSNLGGQLVVGVELVLSRGDAALASERVSEIVAWRRARQPGGRNAGSVFRNPDGDHAGRLIEAAGLKGYRIGTAEVSLKHANFIIVDDGGSASDIYALMCHVRDTVIATSGVTLEFENHLIGWKDEE
jgi:UDP-N-acetylmuramate dehydrogenase